MTNLVHLSRFAKGTLIDSRPESNNNAVIYTRVSSKEQAETNQSLETQKKYCLEYALRHNLNILGFFGGTYESAKTDERNEFNRMIRFVKTQKEKVGFILVYSLDRFSRTGDNAIFISSELKQRGISIVAVTQPIDVSTHAGVLQQNIQFIFSKYDNDLRREKCIAGMREKLLRGEWTGATPIGYVYKQEGKSKLIVPNEKAKYIQQAFEMKSRGMSNTDIARRLQMMGFQLNMKRLSEILRNPIYCGFLSHNLLEGKLMKGVHQPLVSEDLFLKANDSLKRNAYGYKQFEKNNEIPLKNYIRCSRCGTPFTGYLVKSKNLYYYKCNKIGCKCNRSAKRMHELYKGLLRSYQIHPETSHLLKEQLLMTYNYMMKSSEESKSIHKRSLNDIKKKLDTLEERFAFGEVTKEVYVRVSSRFKSEMEAITSQIEGSRKKLSNPEKFVDYALKICENLSELWDSVGYDQRIQLQELLFPGGILFDREIENYRTIEVNQILQLTRSFSIDSKQNKKGQTENKFDLPALVPKAGIEPAHLSVHDFESCASTSSAT